MSKRATGRSSAPLLQPLQDWIHRRCAESTRLGSACMEGPLPLRQRARFWLHLLVCGICRTHERRMARLRALVPELDGSPDPAPLPPLTISRYRQAIAEALASETTKNAGARDLD